MSQPLRRSLDGALRLEARLERRGAERLGWIGAAARATGEGQGLSVPRDWTDERALDALALWPAVCLLRAAPIELGARVAVLGEGSVADGLRGLLAAIGARDGSDAPEAPENVFALGNEDTCLLKALARCRSGGFVVWGLTTPGTLELNLYPDLHRRSLTLVALDLGPGGDPAEWTGALPDLEQLLDRAAR